MPSPCPGSSGFAVKDFLEAPPQACRSAAPPKPMFAASWSRKCRMFCGSASRRSRSAGLRRSVSCSTRPLHQAPARAPAQTPARVARAHRRAHDLEQPRVGDRIAPVRRRRGTACERPGVAQHARRRVLLGCDEQAQRQQPLAERVAARQHDQRRRQRERQPERREPQCGLRLERREHRDHERRDHADRREAASPPRPSRCRWRPAAATSSRASGRSARRPRTACGRPCAPAPAAPTGRPRRPGRASSAPTAAVLALLARLDDRDDAERSAAAPASRR